MSILSKEQMRAILKEYHVKTAEDINHALKDMFGGLLQEALRLSLTRSSAMKKTAKSRKVPAIGAMGIQKNQYARRARACCAAGPYRGV